MLAWYSVDCLQFMYYAVMQIYFTCLVTAHADECTRPLQVLYRWTYVQLTHS